MSNVSPVPPPGRPGLLLAYWLVVTASTPVIRTAVSPRNFGPLLCACGLTQIQKNNEARPHHSFSMEDLIRSIFNQSIPDAPSQSKPLAASSPSALFKPSVEPPLEKLGDKTQFTSIYIGVCWSKETKKWKAACNQKVVGYFLTEIEAARAYDAAKLSADPDALTNFDALGNFTSCKSLKRRKVKGPMEGQVGSSNNETSASHLVTQSDLRSLLAPQSRKKPSKAKAADSERPLTSASPSVPAAPKETNVETV